MFDLLTEGVFYNRQQMFKQRVSRVQLLEQHRAINAALQRRDPIGAQHAVEAHLDYVETMLSDALISRRNESISKQRYEHAQRDTVTKPTTSKTSSN